MSKDSIKLLTWLRSNDDWYYYAQLEKKYPSLEYRTFKALEEHNFIDSGVDESEGPEFDEYGGQYYPKQYRINDNGRAYLESLWTSRADKWITRLISVSALVISLIALLSQLGILELQPS